MKNQFSFAGKAAKNSADQKAILKAHKKATNGLNLKRKGGDYSNTPLFNKDVQTSLF